MLTHTPQHHCLLQRHPRLHGALGVGSRPQERGPLRATAVGRLLSGYVKALPACNSLQQQPATTTTSLPIHPQHPPLLPHHRPRRPDGPATIIEYPGNIQIPSHTQTTRTTPPNPTQAARRHRRYTSAIKPNTQNPLGTKTALFPCIPDAISIPSSVLRRSFIFFLAAAAHVTVSFHFSICHLLFLFFYSILYISCHLFSPIIFPMSTVVVSHT